jgi:ABC-2 type transport system permease protein
MQVIQQSFSHSSSTFMIGKIQGNIVDLLYAPLSATEVTISISLAAATRSFMIAIVSIITFYLIIDIQIKYFFLLFLFTFLTSFILGNIGIISGLWAEKFDHQATITNFVIVPLSFLSGTFYSIERLPDFLKKISELNPFFYMIDGFRFCFIGQSDGSIKTGIIYLLILSILSWLAAYILFKRGYKIKT